MGEIKRSMGMRGGDGRYGKRRVGICGDGCGCNGGILEVFVGVVKDCGRE